MSKIIGFGIPSEEDRKKVSYKNKKYYAIVKIDNKFKKVYFGELPYSHYKDSTPLKHYSNLNHYDEKRRKNFRARHYKNALVKYSPAWFSYHYLW